MRQSPEFTNRLRSGEDANYDAFIEHESTLGFLNRLVDRLSFILRIKVSFFGSATLKRQNRLKGAEPDACFYVQSTSIIGNKINLDLRVDPPPDVVLEVDIPRILSRFHIYEGLGVPELWHYHEKKLTMYHLQEGRYEVIATSIAFPILTSEVLDGISDPQPKRRSE